MQFMQEKAQEGGVLHGSAGMCVNKRQCPKRGSGTYDKRTEKTSGR